MSYLIDTYAWIGFFEGRRDFGPEAKRIMIEESKDCFVSIASVWEAAIKIGLGKLNLPYDLAEDLPRLLEGNGFEMVGLDVADVAAVRDLERLHGDPFDRLQLVQARLRGWTIVSRDPIFDRYDARRLW